MKQKMFKTSAIALLFGMGAVIAAPAALAQTSSAPVVCPGYVKGKATLVGERTGKKVQQAFEAYNEDRVDDAIDILAKLEPSDDFDKAYVNRFLGNLLAAKDGEGMRALGILKSAVSPKVLNDSEHSMTLKLIGDLAMQERQYNQAVEYYNKWMDFTCKQDADVYTRMSQAYYESQQLDKMIEPADKAIALYDKPNKNPYVLKLTSYYERKMIPQTIAVAEELVRVFAETEDAPRWFTQLGFFYMLNEDYKKALSIFEIAYNQGYLKKESEIKTLSQLYATNNIPIKAAQLMEKYIDSGLIKNTADNLASLANSYHQAKNYKTAAKFYGKAAEMSSDPEHYQKQGTLLLVAEDYKGAIKALNSALERGAEDVARIHFTLMEANFYAGDFKAAYAHVMEARKDRSMRRNANAWEPYIKEKAKNRGIKI